MISFRFKNYMNFLYRRISFIIYMDWSHLACCLYSPFTYNSSCCQLKYLQNVTWLKCIWKWCYGRWSYILSLCLDSRESFSYCHLKIRAVLCCNFKMTYIDISGTVTLPYMFKDIFFSQNITLRNRYLLNHLCITFVFMHALFDSNCNF